MGTGRNVYKLRESQKSSLIAMSKTASSLCVFISHRQKDLAPARQLAAFFRTNNIDYYFDEEDGPLQQATDEGDPKAVLDSIEQGLSLSTHLIGIITKNSGGSAWMPFESGQARVHRMKMGHIILESVSRLPEYMCVSTDIQTTTELINWINSAAGRPLLEQRAGYSSGIKGLPITRWTRAKIVLG